MTKLERVTCPDPRELHGWLNNLLPSEAMAAVGQHVASCEHCASTVARAGQGTEPLTKVIGPNAVGGDERPVPMEPGTRLGRYLIVEELGEGGMGAVYLAYDPGLDRRVALKLLHHVGHRSSSARARLEREAQALARVSHPNTVAVYDVGTSGDNIFIAMEHLQGVTLRDWLQNTPRNWKEITDAFIQAARGLAAVHAAGLVHRDFKPANVIVTTSGQAKVLDFGLARLDGGSESSTDEGISASSVREGPSRSGLALDAPLTEAGNVAGTPGFIAPELFEEAPATPASDQFAFGVCLFQALFGRRPFEGGDFQGYFNALRAGPARTPPGSNVPAWLAAIALKCLARRPEERFPSMESVIAALENDPAKKRRWWAMGAAIALALGLTLWAGTRVSSRARCPTEADLKTSVWGTSSSAVIRNRLVTARPAFTPRIDLTLTLVGEATSVWATQAHASCEALRRPNPSLIELQREACLQRQRQALTVLVDAMAQADASVVPRIDEVVEHFLEALGCESDQAVMRVRPDDVGPAHKELASRLRAQLFRARVLANLKDLTGAFAEAQAVAAQAGHAGLKGFESEAKVTLGDIEVVRGNTESAVAQYEGALALGLEAGTDERAFYAGASLIRQIREFRDRIGEAKQVMLVVEALFVRLGKDAPLEMELLKTRAAIADGEGKLNKATEFERRRLDLARSTMGPRSRAAAEAMEDLAERLWKNGQIAESNAVHAEKFDFYFSLYGPNDPAVMYMYPVLTAGLMAEGRVEAARESLESAIVQANQVLSADDETTQVLKLRLSEALEGVNENRSLELAREALAFFEKGTSKADQADALTAEARALVALGDRSGALARCERAAKLRVDLVDPYGNHRRSTLICRALVHHVGEPARAVALWREALAVRPVALPGTRGRMAFGLAQALWRTGSPKAEAQKWAAEAKDAYSAFDFSSRIAEIDAWLAALP